MVDGRSIEGSDRSLTKAPGVVVRYQHQCSCAFCGRLTLRPRGPYDIIPLLAHALQQNTTYPAEYEVRVVNTDGDTSARAVVQVALG